MGPATFTEWLESIPLLPYKSRTSLAKAAWDKATEIERAKHVKPKASRQRRKA